MKICRECGMEKQLTEFHRNKKWYRGRCKKCHNAKFMPPTGKPNLGRFKKGQKPIAGFKKGHVPWTKGKKLSKEQIEKTASKIRGRKQSPEEIEKRRQALLKSWENKKTNFTRWSQTNRQWSKKVRERDNFTCQQCQATNVKLHAHHIKSWKENEMLRFDLDNGMTLCIPCHYKVHKNDERIAWNTGKKLTIDHRKKLSEARLGKIPWNKGLKHADKQ